MVINLKHFIITIIAIFLSLGIGIFIGVVIDSQQLFIEQQKVLVTQIEEEFHGFKQKNYELMNKLEEYRSNNERNEEFIDLVYENLIEENSFDQKVMVINMSTDEGYLDISEVLNNIGIEKEIEFRFPKEFYEKTEGSTSVFSSIFKIDDINKDKIYEELVEKKQSNIFMNGYSILPHYLKEMGLLVSRGSIYSQIDFVIIIDSGININNREYKAVRKDLIDLIRDNNTSLMVVENSNIKSSSIPFYKELGISTVDNADTKLGKIAMLMVLKGQEGHFGEKKAAEELLPEGFLTSP